MNNKIIKQSLTYMVFFSIGGILSGCQMVHDVFSDGQDTAYDYTTVKRRANVAPTVIYRDSDSSYRQSPRSAGGRSSYNERSTVSSGTTTSGETTTSNDSMQSSVPKSPFQSKPAKSAIVPTEAPAVPSMAPTFAP